MQVFQLSDMTKGWFVGDFQPTALPSSECEVAVKHYVKGDAEARHVHKVASEVTLIVKGRVRMEGKEYGEGAIIVLAPGDPTDFEALEDCTTVVVKTPCVAGDKYPA